jgi:hypothetical protein
LGIMSKPLSDRKIAANRANSQKSTGPKTQQGKDAVRHNALQHGMYATTTAVRLPIDDHEIFHALHCEWRRLYPPRDLEEHTVLEAFVTSHWRYVRQLGIENRIFTGELQNQDKLRARGNSLQPDVGDPIACLAYVYRGRSSLDVCSRQIARQERSWMKLLDLLRKLHKRPDSQITVPLAPELRQPPPAPEVPRKPPAAAPSAEPSKNSESKPPAEAGSPLQKLAGLYEQALFEADSPGDEPETPGDLPIEEPSDRE